MKVLKAVGKFFSEMFSKIAKGLRTLGGFMIMVMFLIAFIVAVRKRK